MEANRAVVVAVASAATGTVILAGICFWFFYRFMMARQRRKNMLGSSFRREDSESVTLQEFRGAGAVKGVIVDDNGLDFIYLRRLDNGQVTSCFSKIWVNPMKEEEEEEEKRVDGRGEKPTSVSKHIQETPLLQHQSNLDFAKEEKALEESPLCVKNVL